jgi:hypothetical protein
MYPGIRSTITQEKRGEGDEKNNNPHAVGEKAEKRAYYLADGL